MVDHGSLEQQLNLSASLGRQCFNITITNDEVVEEDELFQLSIPSISYVAGNSRIYRQDIVAATVTIIDDDCKSFTLTTSSQCSQ